MIYSFALSINLIVYGHPDCKYLMHVYHYPGGRIRIKSLSSYNGYLINNWKESDDLEMEELFNRLQLL